MLADQRLDYRLADAIIRGLFVQCHQFVECMGDLNRCDPFGPNDTYEATTRLKGPTAPGFVSCTSRLGYTEAALDLAERVLRLVAEWERLDAA